MKTLQQVLDIALQTIQPNNQTLSVLAESGALLNFVPSQISQLQDDLICLYGRPLSRFPEPQDISSKLAAVQRLHQQIPEQNGILWQYFREKAAALSPVGDAVLMDILLGWLFTHISQNFK